MPGPYTVNKSRARRQGMVKTTTAVLATVAAAAILSIAVAPIGYAYATPGGQAAPIGIDGADGAHGGDYDGEGGTCPFKDRQGASVQGAWQVI